MNITIQKATPADSSLIGKLVCALTQEICERSGIEHFDNDVQATSDTCNELMSQNHIQVYLAYSGGKVVGLMAVSTTYALYVRGMIGVIQEFYVVPDSRSYGVGAEMLSYIENVGHDENWKAIELCTPPLPEFENTLQFYQKNGLDPVGGRKMRKTLS